MLRLRAGFRLCDRVHMLETSTPTSVIGAVAQHFHPHFPEADLGSSVRYCFSLCRVVCASAP